MNADRTVVEQEGLVVPPLAPTGRKEVLPRKSHRVERTHLLDHRGSRLSDAFRVLLPEKGRRDRTDLVARLSNTWRQVAIAAGCSRSRPSMSAAITPPLGAHPPAHASMF